MMLMLYCLADFLSVPTVSVLEDTMLADNVGADQLDVLRDVGLGRPDPGDALLQVVEETLGQGGVGVQVHQVGSLLRGEESDCFAIL